MVRQKIWILSVLGVALAASFLFWRDGRGARLQESCRKCEATCLSLSNSLAEQQEKLDWNRLEWYYAFREVEVEDHEAWRRACHKVDSVMSVTSNSLCIARERLGRLKASLPNCTSADGRWNCSSSGSSRTCESSISSARATTRSRLKCGSRYASTCWWRSCARSFIWNLACPKSYRF